MSENQNSEIIEFESLSSTNDEAKKFSKNNNQSVWILTKIQTNGRGRFNRKWLSKSNNLTASFLFYPNVSTSKFPFYSLIASLSIYDVFIKLGLKKSDLLIKWPNDILAKNKKIAGILLELGEMNIFNKPSLIIGIGINLNSFPSKEEILNNNAISLKQFVKTVPDKKNILMEINTRIVYWNNIFINNGFNLIKKAFLERTYPIGKEINVRLYSDNLKGSFDGINDEGNLLLKTKNGIEKIFSGEIF